MEVYQPERRQLGQARERHAARQRKEMVTRSAPEVAVEKPIMSRAPYDPGLVNTEIVKGRALVWTRDAVWYVKHNRLVLFGLVAVVVALDHRDQVFEARFPSSAVSGVGLAVP